MNGTAAGEPDLRQVVIVTGTGQGIGRATVLRLWRDGWRVVAVDRNQDRLDRLAAETRGEIGVVVGDAGDPEVARRAVELSTSFGVLRGFVSGAGTSTTNSLHDASTENWTAELHKTLAPPVVFLRAVLPELIRNGGGSVVLLSSVLSRSLVAGTATYAAAKGAIEALARQTAVEYGRHGVRVNTVSPGFIAVERTEVGFGDWTERRGQEESTPLRRLGEPGDVAGAIAFLLSDDAAYVTAADLLVDGGVSAQYAPGVLRPNLRARVDLSPVERTYGESSEPTEPEGA